MKIQSAVCLMVLTLIHGAAAAPATPAAPAAPPAEATGQHARRLRGRSESAFSLNYLLYLPRDYGKVRKRWPVILYLHGGSQRGDDPAVLKGYGLPKLLESRKDFPFVVVSPQCPAGEIWSDAGALVKLLDEVAARYAVDEARVYLTGISMGGYGTWYLAYKHPERFAAIAPLAPYSPITYWASSGRLLGTPVWMFHGEKDEVTPLGEASEMARLLKQAGGDVRLSVLEGQGHGIADVYEDERLYEWFLRHRRGAGGAKGGGR